MAEDPVFIPCEICNEPVEISEYSVHTVVCNSARFMEFHGISLNYLLNPINQIHAPQPELDLADNLASADEEEPEDELEEELDPEDDEPIGGEPQLNVRVMSITNILHALRGAAVGANANIAGLHQQLGLPQQGELPGINNLMQQVLNLIGESVGQANGLPVDIDGLGNLEDVVVGLTPEQIEYCLTAKTRDEPGTCNICCEDGLEEMTQLICGHELCAPCATKHFSERVKCPFCNQDLRDMM